MKKLLIAFGLIISSLYAYSQNGYSSVFLRVTDSATFVNSANTTSKHAAGYSDIWYSVSSGLFWEWNAATSTYVIMGSRSGAFWKNQGTTNLTGTTTINGGGFDLSIQNVENLDLDANDKVYLTGAYGQLTMDGIDNELQTTDDFHFHSSKGITIHAIDSITFTSPVIKLQGLTGSAGEFFAHDGTWQTPAGGGATAAGATGNVQFKSAGGGLQAETELNYDSALNTLQVPNVSGPSGLNIQSNGVTRYAIGSTGTHAFAQSSQAGTNTFISATQAAHTAGNPVGMNWIGGAHTGSTASVDAIDVGWDFSAVWTKATGAVTMTRTFPIAARTYAFAGSSTISDAITIWANAPLAGSNATITRSHAIWGTDGYVTANQSVAGLTQGFLNRQSTNLGHIQWRSSNVWRFTTATGDMNVGPTGASSTLYLTSSAGVSHIAETTNGTAYTFSSAGNNVTSGRTFLSNTAGWVNAGAGTHTFQTNTSNFSEANSGSSTYLFSNWAGALNFTGSITAATVYWMRFNPTLTSLTNTTLYGIAVVPTQALNGFGTATPTSTLHTTGSFAAGYTEKTANYTLTATDRLVNCTANSFTITLPTAVGITGREYLIKNTGSATTITIATTSSQTIDGSAPGTITTLIPLRVVSDGANWITF